MLFATWLIMYNPKDFVPAKYKKITDKVSDSSDDQKPSKVAIDSPWSDLAKEPQTPEYRSNVTLGEDGIKNELDASSKLEELKEISQEEQLAPSSLNLKKNSSNKKKLTGLLMVFFLVIGVFASYMLSKQNQDTRQQASGGEEPYPDLNDNSCGAQRTRWSDGVCRHESCRKLNDIIICGYTTDQDPCTEQSLGGDWCDDPNTSRVENCEESDLMRCQCSSTWWVIGKAPSCSVLCQAAGADCSDCTTPTPTPPPNNGGGDDPTPTPTPPAEKLACGVAGCTQNDDCQNGLTCQAVTVDSQSTGICAKGENQLFCAAEPTTDNCCVSQAMPVCASIEMLDTNNNLMENDDDKNLKPGDEVRFRCSAVGNQDVDFDYQFRIWDRSTANWVNITDSSGTVAKNVSDKYTIGSFGKYVVQGRICWGTECQVWETVEGAPTTKGEPLPLINDMREVDMKEVSCVGNADICEDGYVCAVAPPGGCPTMVVDGVERMSACAYRPTCRKAEGIECTADNDCFEGYNCYQRSQPDCLPGVTTCQKVKPSYCVKQGISCTTDSDCESWEKCYQPPMPEYPDRSQVMPAKYCRDLAD